MEAVQYNLEYFIAKFEAKPEDQWTVGKYVDWNGCKCVYGHCGVSFSVKQTPEAIGLLAIEATGDLSLIHVNDNKFGEYGNLGSTPRQRVVNYLKSLR